MPPNIGEPMYLSSRGPDSPSYSESDLAIERGFAKVHVPDRPFKPSARPLPTKRPCVTIYCERRM
jgi:hypothetical protein